MYTDETQPEMDLFLKVKTFVNSLFTDLKYKLILYPISDSTTYKPIWLFPSSENLYPSYNMLDYMS